MKLELVRFRPGAAYCCECNSIFTYDELYQIPGSSARSRKTICERCAIRYCAIRGLHIDVIERTSLKGGVELSDGVQLPLPIEMN